MGCGLWSLALHLLTVKVHQSSEVNQRSEDQWFHGASAAVPVGGEVDSGAIHFKIPLAVTWAEIIDISKMPFAVRVGRF